MTLFNHSLHFSEPLYGRDPFSYHKMARGGGFEYYETRAHGCTKPGDVIQFDPDLQQDYPYAQEHYRRVGLDCTDHVIWDLAAQVADEFPAQHLSVYLFIDKINAVRPNPARLQATKTYLNKNSFMSLCQGIAPVPKTVFGNTARAVPDYTDLAFPLYVKGAISSTGSSVYGCTTALDVERAIAHVHGEYQLQQGVPAVAFLSVLYNITPAGKVVHLQNTEQIIDGVEYMGTTYPTPYRPDQATEAIAHKAAEDGLRGKMGIDVAVTADGSYFVLECNPRWTGALYPMVIAQRLGAAEWSTLHTPVRAQRLKDIALGDLQYDPRRKTGAVLVNWGGIRYQWLELLLIGPKAVQQELRAALSKVL